MEDDANRLDQIMDSLSECLAQSKRPLGLLLGAGCPVSIRVLDGNGGEKPLIPDIAGLTRLVRCALQDSNPEFGRLVSRLDDDLEKEPNIEEILSHIRGLALIVGKQSVHGLDAEAIDGLERAVTTQIMEAVNVDLPPGRTPYDDLAIWARAAARDLPIRIFTTNYDLLLEAALERNGAPFFDGFVGAKEPFFDTASIEADNLPSRWTRVVKLHGSSNWAVRPEGRVVRLLPSDSDERRLIHPSHLKYTESRQMPYLVMFDQLRDFLKTESATLVILGYSFRDDHINDLLGQGLRGNASAKIFGLQYDTFSNYELAASLATDNLGLTIVATDSGIDAGRSFTWQTENGSNGKGSTLGDFKMFGEHLRSSVGRTVHVRHSDDSVIEELDVNKS